MKQVPMCLILSLLIFVPLVVSDAQADPSRCETLGAWSEPVNLGPPINTEAFEGSATLSPNGLSLYFTSNRPGSLGGNDLWVSQRECADCSWEEPVNLMMLNTGACCFSIVGGPVGSGAWTSGSRIEATRAMTSAGKPQ